MGFGFERLGYEVIFYDIDENVVKELSMEHKVTKDLNAIKNTDISFICVPTPYDNGFTQVISYLQQKESQRR